MLPPGPLFSPCPREHIGWHPGSSEQGAVSLQLPDAGGAWTGLCPTRQLRRQDVCSSLFGNGLLVSPSLFGFPLVVLNRDGNTPSLPPSSEGNNRCSQLPLSRRFSRSPACFQKYLQAHCPCQITVPLFGACPEEWELPVAGDAAPRVAAWRAACPCVAQGWIQRQALEQGILHGV